MKTRIEDSRRSAPRDGGLSNRTIRTLLAEDQPLLMALLARVISTHERVFIVGADTHGEERLLPGMGVSRTPVLLSHKWRAKKILKPVLFLLTTLLLFSGCAHYPRNARLASSDISTGYRFRDIRSPTNASDLLLILAFSGGGTRAASLSYGVLEQLARTPAGPEGAPHRMLDEVDIISSVSGGSFTAAYYALWGDRIFSDFESKFLKKNYPKRFATSLFCSVESSQAGIA